MIQGIRKALETQLAAITPAWATAWENMGRLADAGSPFQRVYLLPGSPVSEGVFRGSAVRHVGIFQVDVCTPLEGGPTVGDARAELIRGQFRRGTSLAVAGAQNLWVPDHPAIGGAIFDATWRVLPVTIPWNIFEGV